MKSQRPDVNDPTLLHYAIVLPFVMLIKLWQKTVRLVADDESAKLMSSPERMVGVGWHSRIFFLPMCKYYYRDKFPMNGLVSASRDGAYLCAAFRFMDIGAVRGSYQRRGVSAVMAMIDSVKNGADIFITPDGPRGPKNKAKSGFVTVAKESGARVLALKITPHKYWRIGKTWDKFILPKPFSKATVKALEFKTCADLEAAAAARNITPAELIEDFLNSDNID